MPQIGPEEFAIPFFAEQGFTRRKCPNCGSDFWAQKPDQQFCGEVPCQPYTFIGNPPTRRRYTVPEMRIQFMDYFAEKGHTRIPPYPIVARWRDDVYLVGASIYDFQPYVTEGSMPPPANPLVISQPCIRFTDVELVGPTMGRHMTIFEMGGAHAFNYPTKEIYWKDECVRYHHELLTNVVGVPSESVTYKEHFWSGGGNAGPDLETIVAGLEIDTLVFMQYKVRDEQLTPIPIRTVDTGYGIERWSWLSQGSPSGFHAVHGPVLEQVLDLANLHPDEQLLQAFTQAAGAYGSTIKTNRDSYIQTVSQQTGQEVGRLSEVLSSLEAVYAITDHSKAIAFLLAEGVVPSNVGEGYLARLIIRRAARLARQLGFYQQLPEIVEGQVKLWGNDFRNLREMRSEIREGLVIEMKKYQETIARGSEIVVRLSKDLASKGIKKIPTDELVRLYDSQGLSPEIVQESAEKVGIEVEVPDNFLTLVAERHLRPSTGITETTRETDLESKLQQLPPTRTLYYEDAYKTKFRAKVIAKVAENAVVLDQTIFYPEGGGQLADHGELEFSKDKKAKVVDVQKFGDVIVHYLAEPVPFDSDIVEGEIDWQRRQNLMRHHTGTHVLLGAARGVLGEHVWQAGAQKEVESSRIDITHYNAITPKERDRIERLANQLILRDVPVSVSWMAREKAEAKYGYRLYQGGAVPGSKIRVVRIAGWDAEACGGTHVKRTGELGVFRIEKIDRLQDGVERIIFTAGEPSLKRIKENAEELEKTVELLKTTPERLPNSVKSLIAERDGLEKELNKYQAKALEAQIRRLEKSAKTIGPIQLVATKIAKRKGVDPVEIANRLKEFDKKIVAVIFEVSDRVQLVVAAGEEAVQSGVNAGEIVSVAAKVLSGGGGGRPFFATGGGSAKEKADDALKVAEETVQRQVGLAATEQVA